MKKNVIIFMGVDCTGKSTISKYVSNELGYPLQHSGVLKTHDEAKEFNYNRMNSIKSNIVLDRSYMDEVVYAPVYRRYSANYIEDIEKQFMKKFNVIIVYVTASNKKIEERFNSRGEEFTKIEDINKLKSNYNKFFETSLIENKIKIDTTNDLTKSDMYSILDIISNKLEK